MQQLPCVLTDLTEQPQGQGSNWCFTCCFETSTSLLFSPIEPEDQHAWAALVHKHFLFSFSQQILIFFAAATENDKIQHSIWYKATTKYWERQMMQITSKRGDWWIIFRTYWNALHLNTTLWDFKYFYVLLLCPSTVLYYLYLITLVTRYFAELRY